MVAEDELLDFALLTERVASPSPAPALNPAATTATTATTAPAPPAASADMLQASSATPSHACTHKRTAVKQARQAVLLHATTPPPQAKRRKSTKSTTSQRPSAAARLVRAGHKGRPRKGQGFPWDNPAVQKRMRELKQQYTNGELTQTVRSVAFWSPSWSLRCRSSCLVQPCTGTAHVAGSDGCLTPGLPWAQRRPPPPCCAASSATSVSAMPRCAATLPCEQASLGRQCGPGSTDVGCIARVCSPTETPSISSHLLTPAPSFHCRMP